MSHSQRTCGARSLMRTAGVALTLMLLAVFSSASPAVAQLRIVTWNTFTQDLSDFTSRQTDFNRVLDYIGREPVNGIARPIDVLMLQEQSGGTGPDNLTLDAFAAELNTITQTSDYVAWSETPNASSGFRTGYVYNSTTVSSIHEDWFKTQNARSTARIRVRAAGYGSDADIWMYNTHYTAGTSPGDLTERRNEAFAVRITTGDGQKGTGTGVDSGVPFGSDTLPAGSNIIYGGDYNMRNSAEEPASDPFPYVANPYQIMQLDSSDGFADVSQAVDPINTPGNWHDNIGGDFRAVHTQNPAGGGFFGGGMDDRFDFQQISNTLNDGEGVSYIAPGVGNSTATEASYHAFGNNGTHPLNGAINNASNTGLDWIITELGETATERNNVRNSLAAATDHLPVVADYQLPAKMGVTVETVPSPFIVRKDAVVDLDFTVENTAPVDVVAGADELDYEIAGNVTSTIMGVDQPTGGGNLHSVTLDTSAFGMQSVDVTSSSQAVADGSFSFDFQVALGGDATLDDFVDFDDFLALQGNFNMPGVWTQGNFNGDSVVNFDDFLIMQGNFNMGVAPEPFVASIETVPEPSTWLILGCGLVALLATSRTRRMLAKR